MNVRFLIEGGEETGSEGLPELLQEMKKDFLKVNANLKIQRVHVCSVRKLCQVVGIVKRFSK